MEFEENLSAIVLIPAWNEAHRIEPVITGAQGFLPVLVVDDGSQDETAVEAQSAGARVIRQGQNLGYIQAIKRGFAEASGKIVVTIDADGEFPPEQIPALIRPILDGEADMVQGHRDIVPRPSERFLNWLSNLKAPVGDSGTGFRAILTSLAQKLELKGACICGIFSLEVLFRGGRIKEIPIRLRSVAKPRRIAWYHVRQLFFLLRWLFRKL